MWFLLKIMGIPYSSQKVDGATLAIDIFRKHSQLNRIKYVSWHITRLYLAIFAHFKKVN